LLVDQDECWFSRFTHPQGHSWALAAQPTRLIERSPAKDEPDKALACFGAVRQDTKQRYLFFAQGQPNTDYTIAMLQHLVQVAAAEDKAALIVIWDRASWHHSQPLKAFLRAHNQQAKAEGGVRILTFLLPTKSPWLNPMEPIWLHAKRQVDEPDGQLSADELTQRLCDHFQVEHIVLEPQSSDDQ